MSVLKQWLPLIALAVYHIGTVTNNDDFIFVTDLTNATIWMGSVTTFELTEIPSLTLDRPVAVNYDPVNRMVYWTDVQRNTISRANIDGTGEEILICYLSVPDGLAIDSINRYMYWTDSGTNKRIERADLDGTGDCSTRPRTTIVDDGLEEPRAIVVDPVGGLLFWTDWGNHSKIERSNADGSERVIIVDTELIWPNGIALDIEGQRIYWCDAGMNRIETTNINGGNRVKLFEYHDIDIHPFDIGISGTDLYWTDWRFTKLFQMDRYSGQTASLVGPPVFQQGGGVCIVSLPPTTTDEPSTERAFTSHRLTTMEATTTKVIMTTPETRTTSDMSVVTTNGDVTSVTSATTRTARSTPISSTIERSPSTPATINIGLVIGVTMGILVCVGIAVVAILYWFLRIKRDVPTQDDDEHGYYEVGGVNVVYNNDDVHIYEQRIAGNGQFGINSDSG